MDFEFVKGGRYWWRGPLDRSLRRHDDLWICVEQTGNSCWKIYSPALDRFVEFLMFAHTWEPADDEFVQWIREARSGEE